MTNNEWPTPNQPSTPWPIQPVDPRDTMSRDELLMKWEGIKKELSDLKEKEQEFRKYIVKRAFPDAKEGMNNQDLGNGYTLKAGVKYNYKLAENKKVEACLDRIAKVGNQGEFIAERLVSWTPNFLLTEYRNLQEQEKDGSKDAKAILAIVNEMLTVDTAMPTLEIKEPKGKK